MTRARLLATLAAVAIVAGVPCGAYSQETLKVAIPQRGAWDAGVAELGQRGGIFKKHGLELEIVYTNGAGETQQAVISGSYSLTRQAIQLGYVPRMEVRHTSASEIGQIYLPRVNWILMVGVIALVVGFQSSNGLAGAYGIAVTGTMASTTRALPRESMPVTLPRRDDKSPMTSPIYSSGVTTSTFMMGSKSTGPALGMPSRKAAPSTRRGSCASRRRSSPSSRRWWPTRRWSVNTRRSASC